MTISPLGATLHNSLAALQSNPFASKATFPHYWWFSAPFFMVVYISVQAAKSFWRDYLAKVKRNAVAEHIEAVPNPPKPIEVAPINNRSPHQLDA